jgi:ribonuclease HI
MAPRQKKARELGCVAMVQGKNLVLALGSTVFQAEVYAFKACIDENLDRGYKNKNIYILSDSKAAIKALGKYQITSKLVWDCHQSLIQLARHNRVQLIWVPGHEGIAGNEIADQLARTGSEHLFTGPEPACSISIGAAKKAVSNWLNRKHTKQWESIIGLKQAKELITEPSAKRTRDLLKLNRDQLRWIVGLYTGHCHLNRHLFKMGLMNDPICERCLEADESATYVLHDCEALAHLRFRHLGQFFMEPDDFYDVPIRKVLHFIRSVGLTKGYSKGKHNRSEMVAVLGPNETLPYHIHTYILRQPATLS